MKARCALALLACMFVTALSYSADGKEDQTELAKRQKAKLQGEWLFVGVEKADGTKLKAAQLKNWKVVIEKDKLTITLNGKDQEFTFTLDPATDPKSIDVTPAGGMPSPGIYSLDGDELRMVLDEKDKVRAKGFILEEGTSHILMVMKRKK